jgi:predicted acyltransferase
MERAYSLDAFRGLTMVWMISVGFGLRFFLDDPVLGPVALQFTHHKWHGAYAWDFIQPFFMFIVGVAMPFSFRRRWQAGESWGRSLLHVLKRAGMLLLLGCIARSIQAKQPNLDLINVLSQLAFTYPLAFLVLRKNWKVQGATALGFLVAAWIFFRFCSFPGVTGPWDESANPGWALDRLMLGKNWGSYTTINCVASTATTIFGVMAGAVLASGLDAARKLRILVLTGVAGVVVGLALDPVIPIIKRIWTPSWAIYSGGASLLALALFYWVCDVKKWRRWAQILAMVGANSIFIYLVHEILAGWLSQTGTVFTGWAIRAWGPWGKLLNANLVIAFQVYLCVWLYRKKIFFKL